jgi:hypothetical protein
MSTYVSDESMGRSGAYNAVKNGIMEAMSIYKESFPEDDMSRFRYYTYSPDPGRLMNGIAESVSSVAKNGSQKGVVIEFSPSDRGTSHGMAGIFGAKFADVLQKIGGHFYITVDIEVKPDSHGEDSAYVEVRDVEFDHVGTPAKVASELRKIATRIDASRAPSRRAVSSEIRRLLTVVK